MPELMSGLDRALSVSPWFKRSGGYDHLLMVSHWHVSLYTTYFRKFTRSLGRCSQINFENQPMPTLPSGSVTLPNLYVGKICKQNGKPRSAGLRHQPPKVMGFQFIGDISKRAAKYKQSLIHANGKDHSLHAYPLP